MPDPEYFLEQAAKCRRLARNVPDREAKALPEMAAEFEEKAAELGGLSGDEAE